ncbi:MAG: ATP-grasp domain-containing protein [Thermosynechococcaceae cyanobacterium]
MRIVNHDIMNCTHQQVTGNHLYSGRVLGLTEPNDVVQLHPALRSEWQAIVEHYDRIGLRHSQNVIWDISSAVRLAHPQIESSVFYFGDSENPNSIRSQQFRCQDQRWHDVVQYMNNKNNFMELAHQLQVTVPKTLCFGEKAEVRINSEIPYPCYVKPSVSVDGMGIVRCANRQELLLALYDMPEKTPFQLQEEVLAASFLNLQYQVTEEGLKRHAATEQILDGCSHSGNRYPTEYHPWDLVEPMAQWMMEQGMKDIFAFDVAVVFSSHGPRYYAIECNPRYNGASYPTGVAFKLGINSWICETFTTPFRSLSDFDLSGIEFDAKTGVGVILINWGSIHTGKVVCLLAGSHTQQDQFRSVLKQRFNSDAQINALMPSFHALESV